MTLTLTVVHAPSALTAQEWETLHRTAGRRPHELRLSLQGAPSPHGGQIEEAIIGWLQKQLEDSCGRRLRVSVAGAPLSTLPAESGQIHPGMVVLLSRRSPSLGALRSTAPDAGAGGLRLCIDQGPDAGRLLPLRRGTRTLGRAGEIRVSDPAMARLQGRLTMGDRGILWEEQETERLWTTGTSQLLGGSTFRLISGPPPPGAGGWPVPPGQISEKPPEGRHRMTLVMALVPLVIGVVLVTMTGMWFFLLFSAVSALVALATVIDAARRRRHHRRALRRSAEDWARRRDAALPTPGQLAHRLRDGLPPALPPDTLRLGTGLIPAELETTLSTSEAPPRTEVLTGVALEPASGGMTVLRGHRRETGRLLRWILLQLLLRPSGSRPPVVLLEDRDITPPPEAGDLSGFTVLRRADLRGDRLPAALTDAPAGILILPEDVPCDLLGGARTRGWHLIVCTHTPSGSGRTSTAAEEGAQTADLFRRRLSGGEAMPPVAEQMRSDGLSADTFAELLRLGLPHAAGAESSGLPAQYDAALPDPLMTRSARRTLTTELGRGPEGPELLDLVGDGPHILLAGTSGSGKSELLKSLMLGWAAAYGPEEVNFVLFDFKGGSTFQRIARLEHSLGLVTDLSQAQAERTLEGIRSELTRREHLFLEAGAGDYAEYRRLEPGRPLARILVVIDEFRIFSHELPETMDELMRLATLGRSLGLHLVLATQRPQGVVTADIRANIGTVVALRLRGEDESEHLVGTRDAGHIPRDLPGRGIIRRPGEPPRPFQSARLSSGAERLLAVPESPQSAEEPAEWTDTAPQIVGRLADAAQGRRRPHTPLLPPLPEELVAEPCGGPALLGLVDDPAQQDQRRLVFSPAEPRSLALIGEGGSGGVRALTALAAQLLSGPQDVRLHLLDGDRSLERFRDHPRTDSWLTEEHLPELDHLLTALKDELTVRRTGRAGPSVPLVILMSGHSQWHMAAQSAAPGQLDHVLGTLIGEGGDCGISAVLSGGRELVSGKLGARVPHRIYLPYGVSEDTSFLWPRLRPVDGLAGRGVWVGPQHPAPGLEVHLVGSAPEPPPGRIHAQAAGPGLGVHPLPEELSAEQLPAVPSEHSSPGPSAGTGPAVGIAQFTHSPVHMEIGPVNLILGARGTGKSSCLALLGERLGDRALRWDQLAGAEQLASTAEGPPEVLLVDDADRLGADDHQRLEVFLQQGVRIVAAAAPGAGIFTALPWAHRARGSRGNMLLSPTHRSQADVFAVSAPVLNRPIPGRAVLLHPEGPVMLQWALPSSQTLPSHPVTSQRLRR